VRVAAESGVIGLSFFLLIIGLTLRELSRMPEAFRAIGDEQLSALAWGLKIAFVGYLILQAGHPLNLSIFFWILPALTAVMKRILTEQEAVYVQNGALPRRFAGIGIME
jgi:hypothetical protein